jgi:hypothetical protein
MPPDKWFSLSELIKKIRDWLKDQSKAYFLCCVLPTKNKSTTRLLYSLSATTLPFTTNKGLPYISDELQANLYEINIKDIFEPIFML